MPFHRSPEATPEAILGTMLIEFFFDFSCPYAYLGSTQIEAVAEKHAAELVWKPMLLGGVFRSVETPMNLALHQSPAKTRHGAADMHRWAELWGLPLQMPSGHPMRTVRALRALLACPSQKWPALIHAMYRAYWVDGEDLSSKQAVAQALAEAGISGHEASIALAANTDPSIKEDLRRRTDEAIDRGVFGAPSIFISGEDLDTPTMFWGQDRFDMVEAVLTGWRPSTGVSPQGGRTPRARPTDAPRNNTTIDFWYDFASPFAYLGATQIEALAARTGATLRWRPLLLGALFKSIGTPNVPLFAMSEAKRWYQGRELEMWSSYWQEPFTFPGNFPLRTVTALRLALLAGERIGELSGLLFRAAWADNRDIGDEEVLRELLEQNGFDGTTMLESCSDPATKARLRENTQEAQELGVFGVPTSIITVAGESHLYWGQDRLALIERMLLQS